MVSVPWHFLSDTISEVEEAEGPISSWIFSTFCAGSRHPESASMMALSVSESRSRYLGLFLELCTAQWKRERLYRKGKKLERMTQ